MQVNKVGLDPQRQPVVLLADAEERRWLPIWIGPFEAHAISTSLQGRDFPRPLTHDLLLMVIAGLQGELREVRITRLDEGTFYAALYLDTPNGPLEVDSRPSDALALAVRTNVEVYVAEEVLARAEIQTPEAENEEIGRFRELLGDLGTFEDSGPTSEGGS